MGGGRGLCRVCLPSVGTSPTQGSTTPNTLDASQGPVHGALRDGAWGSWGAVGPTFGFSQGRGVTLEPPAAVPRAGWQELVARPRRTEAQGGRPGPDHQSHGDWRDRPHLRGQRRRRPEGVSSDLWVCARVTLQAASRRLDPPIRCSARHQPDFGPSRCPSRAPCPGCPTLLTRGRFL